MYVAAEGQFENVKLLLAHGADTAIKAIDGDSALVFARNKGNSSVVEYLENFKKE